MLLALAIPADVLLGAGACVAGMGVLYGLGLRARNASGVDLGWTVCLGFLGVLYAVTGVGDPGRRMALGVLVGVWSVRLSLHLASRDLFGPKEDGRYVRLRAYWGDRANVWFLVFYLGQAVLAVLLSLPFWLAANAPAPLGAFDIAAVALFVVALLGESIADRQLARFIADPANKGRTCRDGLWGWSRHPNYFFEWLVWCAYALLALPATSGALGLIAPALMLFLITKVTGIPPTEWQAVRSRGDDYRAYQRTTSPFFPLPPRPEVTT